MSFLWQLFLYCHKIDVTFFIFWIKIALVVVDTQKFPPTVNLCCCTNISSRYQQTFSPGSFALCAISRSQRNISFVAAPDIAIPSHRSLRACYSSRFCQSFSSIAPCLLQLQILPVLLIKCSVPVTAPDIAIPSH